MAEAAIAAHGLVKRFGPVVALDGIDLAVQAGSVLGLLGPNGAGKTAVRILATILEPDADRASVLGFEFVRNAEQLRAVIGLAGQHAAVDENLTGRENLRDRPADPISRGRPSRPAPGSYWAASACRRPPAGRCGPTPVACAAAWTWPPPCSTGPRCCSWTTRPRPGPARLRRPSARDRHRQHHPAVAAGGPTAAHAVAAILWCAGIVAVFAPLAVLRYRRAA